MKTGTTTPTREDRPAPSTDLLHTPQVGEIVLVQVDPACWRPMIVSAAGYLPVPWNTERLVWCVSGTIFAEPEDHNRAAFRGWGNSISRISGRPERSTPYGYGETLVEGDEVGQWRPRL